MMQFACPLQTTKQSENNLYVISNIDGMECGVEEVGFLFGWVNNLLDSDFTTLQEYAILFKLIL